MRQLSVADHWGKIALSNHWLSFFGDYRGVYRKRLLRAMRIRMNAIEAEIERQEMAAGRGAR